MCWFTCIAVINCLIEGQGWIRGVEKKGCRKNQKTTEKQYNVNIKLKFIFYIMCMPIRKQPLSLSGFFSIYKKYFCTRIMSQENNPCFFIAKLHI